VNPLFQAFFEAVQEAGCQLTDDVNGILQEGFAAFDTNRHKGRRQSASWAYLHPVRDRSNLDIETRALSTRIVFDGTTATGVEFIKGGKTRQASSDEIVVSGGAINTPQLLQLSGVGSADELGALGIDTVVDLPGVGENMQDHLEVYIQHSSKQPVSLQPYLALWCRPIIGLQWLFGKGPGASNHFEAGGFIRSNDEVDRPNLMFHFLPLAIRYDGSVPAEGHGYQIHVGPMLSDAKGSVKITSTDPVVKPALRFNYLSTAQDRKEWIEAVHRGREILSQPAFEHFNGGEISPGPDVASDEEILDWVASEGETALHPSCTARMGVDEMSVVDPDSMRVHGTEGLRVVDASVMPSITNGNIYAPVMMIAERAADMILGNTPLPPEQVDWYRSNT
jgi:choline dehydrogenase